jgi:hypothetical protein
MRPLAVVRAERQEMAKFQDRLIQLVQQHPKETAVQYAHRMGLDAEISSKVSQVLLRLSRENVIATMPGIGHHGRAFTLTERGARIAGTIVTKYVPPPLPVCCTQPVGTPTCPRCETRTYVSALAVEGAVVYYACRACADTFPPRLAA